MDENVLEIYRQVADQITLDDFQARVDEKVALMAGLCDGRTAAMLVARDLGTCEVLTKICSIRPETGNVLFIGRVVSISEIREFSRPDGSTGRVVNMTLADETGSVRLALWDEHVELVVSGDLKLDQSLKVRGIAKEGYAGTEVTLGRGGGFEEVDMDIRPRQEAYKISEIKGDMSQVDLLGVVVDSGEPREFLKRDGGKGLVRTVILGDETGKIRLTLWNEQAAMPLENGESLEVKGGSCRERYGSLEVSTGAFSSVKKSSKKVVFTESITAVADLKPGMICSVRGFVTGLGEIRQFQRDDGKIGRIANIYISDDTGRVKVALWGDHVDHMQGLDIGYRAEIIDAQAKSGWNDELEISCGWRTRITFAPPG